MGSKLVTAVLFTRETKLQVSHGSRMEVKILYEKVIEYESQLRYTEAKSLFKSKWNSWREAGQLYLEELSYSVRRTPYSYKNLSTQYKGLSLTQTIMKLTEEEDDEVYEHHNNNYRIQSKEDDVV